jgi:hypothetical protein
MRWLLRPLLLRMGSRKILVVGGGLFLLNMLIPDPLPLVDEFVMLAGTILLSRWANREAAEAAASVPPGAPKPVGRGSTQATRSGPG